MKVQKYVDFHENREFKLNERGAVPFAETVVLKLLVYFLFSEINLNTSSTMLYKRYSTIRKVSYEFYYTRNIGLLLYDLANA